MHGTCGRVLAGYSSGGDIMPHDAIVLLKADHKETRRLFPKVRAGLSRKQLLEIRARLEAAKAKAPHEPQQPSALKKTVDAVIS